MGVEIQEEIQRKLCISFLCAGNRNTIENKSYTTLYCFSNLLGKEIQAEIQNRKLCISILMCQEQKYKCKYKTRWNFSYELNQ